MDLWIRSQDKMKLVKVNDIAIENYIIYGYFDKNTEYEELGIYKTKERALEVLDEIQDKIINSNYYKFDDNGYINNVSHDEIVYEMPKE